MSASFAKGTLTLSGNAVAAETVVVGGVTYTWRAAVGATANEVKVGATAAASAQNLFDAINATPAESGVTFGSATVANPRVRAIGVTATTVVVACRQAGAIGNLVASTETMTNAAWGAATLAGATGELADDLASILASKQLTADVEQALRGLTDSRQVE